MTPTPKLKGWFCAMKKRLTYLLLFLSFQSLASDIITAPAAKNLFLELFNHGGDIYCSANSCSLDMKCTYSKLDPGPHFSCVLNEQEVLSDVDSEYILRKIFDASLTMDSKCSANYCELSAKCDFTRIKSSEYSCEIY